MSDVEDDYSSEGDDDYVPSGEASECDSDEGDPVAGDDSGDEEVTGKVQAKSGKKKKKQLKKKASETTRKRKGGIQIEGEDDTKDSDKDEEEPLIVGVGKEEQERRKEEKEKKRADDLWSSFMKDVGAPPKKAKVSAPVSSAGKPSGSAASTCSKPSNSTVIPPAAAKKETVTITKVFDFAGEKIEVTEKVSADSKEAKSFLKKDETPDQPSSSSFPSGLSLLKPGGAGPSLGGKKPGGLSSILGQIGKKSKISTLEKSKLDWNQFKAKEGIEDELTAFVKGKSGYVEKQNFLARADQRQYERERDLRLSQTKILR